MQVFVSYCLFIVSIILPTHTLAATVQYSLSVSQITTFPDGTEKTPTIAYNGEFPGPLISANVGDTLVINVTNNLANGDPTSVHYHGLFHNGSQFEDGPSNITQCPLLSNNYQVYNFKVSQSGTYWYHSHYQTQLTDGPVGPLIIYNPSDPAVYGYEAEMIVTIQDWFHKSWQANQDFYLSSGAPPFPSSALINGYGQYPCISLLPNLTNLITENCSSSKQFRSVYKVKPGATYRVRVINTSGMSAFTFGIDGHTMKAIEVDGVSLAQPSSPVQYAVLGTGQRYSFLVTMNQGTSGTFNMRAVMNTDFLAIFSTPRFPTNINAYAQTTLLQTATAAVVYDSSKETATPTMSKQAFTYLKYQTQIAPLAIPTVNNSVFLDEMTLVADDGLTAPSTFDKQFVLSISLCLVNTSLRSLFNCAVFEHATDEPLLASYFKGETLPSNRNPLFADHLEVVEIVLNNNEPLAHPVHLHGYVFYVVAKGSPYAGNYDPSTATFKLDTVKRDVILVPQNSYVVIRLVADNPGVWFMHCHIAWHSAGGMEQNLVVAQDWYLNQSGLNHTIPDEAKRVCELMNVTI